MDFQNESEQWTNSSHFPNTKWNSRHSWCEYYSLDRPKMKQFQREVRKILWLLSNSCVFQSNIKVDHSILKSGCEQKLGKKYKFLFKSGQPLELCAFVKLQNYLIYSYEFLKSNLISSKIRNIFTLSTTKTLTSSIAETWLK